VFFSLDDILEHGAKEIKKILASNLLTILYKDIKGIGNIFNA